jgi:RNA polymerase sigma-70 factor, ECF subfamily
MRADEASAGDTSDRSYLFRTSRQYKIVEIPPTESIAEADLVRKARQGNEPAFLAIYRRHRSPVFQFAWRLTGSQAAAEDVTQECFLALMQGAAFDSDRGALRTYLFGIARNLALRRLRISGREAEEAASAAAPIDLLCDLLEAERSELVARAMAQLPILQREAIALFTFEELSLEEIAEIAGVDPGAVKSRLHRARESLRKALAPLMIRDPERRCL